MLHLHDTATGTVRPLELRTEGKASLYVCGPTVYDLPHIGHGRYNLVFDVLRRYLLFVGLDVHYVSNITDVDDNIIKRAAEQGRTESEVALEFEDRVVGGHGRPRRPATRRHATRHGLRGRHGRAWWPSCSPGEWPTKRATASTSTSSQVDGYGLLARQSLDSLRAGARVEANEEKRSPARLRAVEEGQAGRAELGRAVGRRPARLAHRVRRHVARPARRGLRPARRGTGPGLPAPRERAGPGGGRRQGVRPPLGAQRVGRGRGHQDVEVARQLHLAHRHAGAQRRPGLPAAGAAVALPLADRGDDRHGGRCREGAGAPRRAWRGASASATCSPRAAGATVVEARDGAGIDADALAAFRARMDDDLDTPGALAGIFELVTAAHTAADAGDEAEGRARWPARPPCWWAALGVPLRAESDEVDEASARLVAAHATRPGSPRTSPGPTPCATSWWRWAGRSGHAVRHRHPPLARPGQRAVRHPCWTGTGC